MKGSEILERFRRAEKVVAKRSGMLGEIGNCMRSNGYDVSVDGFSVCHFEERDVKIHYIANCYDEPWRIGNVLWISPSYNQIRLDTIDPDKEYEVLENVSVADMVERGDIKPSSYEVYSMGSTYKLMGRFNTLEEADAHARKCAQGEIDSLRKDKDWRPYTSTRVVNNPDRAREKEEIRHYTFYCYDERDFWIGVAPCDD